MIRLMADECIAPAHFRRIINDLADSSPPIIGMHLLDYFKKSGVDDQTWADRLKEDGGWIVISGDLGRGKSPRLPEVLPDNGITGIFLSGKLQSARGEEKMRAIQWLARHITTVSDAERGSRFKLVRHGESFRLEPWPRKRS